MRILPVVWFLLAVAVMVLLHRTLPMADFSAPLLRLLGHAAMAAAFVLIVLAGWKFNRRKTPVRPFAEAEVLVTDGPFRVSRNPIYLGMLLVLAGVALRMGTLTPWLVLPAFVMIINRRIIKPEEEMLARKFPETFAIYRSKVRRWL